MFQLSSQERALSDVTPTNEDSFIVVTTNDGTAIRCQRVSFALSPGKAVMSERRWVFSTSDGHQHIGPTVGAADDPDMLVHEWWAMRQALLIAKQRQPRHS